MVITIENNNSSFSVMIFGTSKKLLCKKSSKKHEHTFSHENYYDDFSIQKKQCKRHVIFSLKIQINVQKA